MKILIAEDEPLALESMTEMVQRICPEAELMAFQSAESAWEAAAKDPPDIAFLDVEMHGMNGVLLAEKLRSVNERVNIIFTTGYGDYMPTAFRLHASGYLLKPVSEEELRAELNNLLWKPKTEKRFKVTAFGSFKASTDGVPLVFQYRKTEELLAYLVDANGRLCTMGELALALWEEDDSNDHSSYLRNLISDLRQVLKERSCEDVLLRRKGALGVDVNRIECDYYSWLQGDAAARKAFFGEYMSQYSWAEATLAWLLHQQ